MRLAKLLAQRGVASRRAAEGLIERGLVTVNGAVAGVVTFVDPARDVVTVRGKPLPVEPPKVYYLLNKPKGYITTRSDPQGRRSVVELIGAVPVRVEAVGRLDYDTEGALLLTNDGLLAHRLTHPSREVPKEYLARVDGRPGEETLAAIVQGVELEDGVTAPARARVVRSAGDHTWVRVTVTEGRNRLVRRMMLKLGYPVIELRRESIGGVALEGLEPGEVRELTAAEVDRLKVSAGLEGESN